jgi:hypothetical protein
MSLNVSRDAVKRKCRIEGSDYDGMIDALIAEQVPVIEHALQPEYLGDTENTGLQATLNLGATEIVAGEFLAELFREPGAYEEVEFGDFRVGSRLVFHSGGVSDPFLLKQQGWARLLPYLKPTIAHALPPQVRVAFWEGDLCEGGDS